MNFETHSNGTPVTPVMPKPVFDVTTPTRWESYSTTLNLITGAIGFTGVAALPAPILSANGDKVGSHWRKNPVWGFKTPVSTIAVVETATSASFNVQDQAYNLEKLFEGNPAGRFVARLTIDGGSEIYGYIGDISASGNVYTFKVYNAPALGTQSWIGTLPASSRAVRKLEIFSNESSISFATGTVLTREIPWDFAVSEQQNMMDLLATMANGDYAVDYARGKIYYKKATTATSDTISYATYGGSGGPTPDINLKEINGVSVTAASAVSSDTNVAPTAGQVYGYNMVYDHVADTWRRQQGGVAHDTALGTITNIRPSGILGGRASDPTSLPSAVAAGDMVAAAFGTQGQFLTYDVALGAGEFLSEGTGGVLATVRQPLSTSTFAGSKDVSSALEASKIVKATTGNLKRTFGVIDKSAPTGMYYVLHLDAATLTADGAVNHLITPIPVNHTNGVDSKFDTDDFDYQVNATSGIVRVLSSTMVTKTITAAYMFATTLYK